MTVGGGWLDVRERGGVLGIRIVVWLATAFGRTAARGLIALVTLYYVLLHRGLRRVSRDYLTRVGQPAGFWSVYRHVLRFAHCSVDRFFLLRRRYDLFSMESSGTELLRETQAAGRGAILLGAHLGSFEAMRAVSARREYRINIVGYFRNARMLNAALEALEPGTRMRVVEIDPGEIGFVFKVKELIEKGEFVAILGDRVGLGARTVTADFLGAPARFPAGPMLMASALRCPVFLTFGLYREPNRYELYCEHFADSITLDRRDRQAALEAHVRRYAERLEHYCRRYPDNWFNFFDFWSPQ